MYVLRGRMSGVIKFYKKLLLVVASLYNLRYPELGGGGVGGSQPPLNFGWGVEHRQPSDFEKILLGGVSSP